MENDPIKTKYKLKEDPIFKYKHLDPLPSEKDLKLFYQKKYFQELKKRKGTKESKLINKKNRARSKELEWLKKTYFEDRLDVFNKYFPFNKKLILDIGCGSGEFLEFMKNSGWKVVGIEPSEEAFNQAKKKGITVYNLPLEEFVSQSNKKKEKFDVIVFDNILEHVLKPKEILMISHKLLSPDGISYIKVPNDFNRLQLLAQKKLNKRKWWIAIPDHINYFNFQSLEKLLKFCGFEVLLKTTDFPMELFLLMGDDYVDNPEIGKMCHQKRVNFEFSISKELRRNLYNKLAELGLGRECIIYARNKI